MKHSEDEAYIFVGYVKDDPHRRFILNNDKELTICELLEKGYWSPRPSKPFLTVSAINIFPAERCKEVLSLMTKDLSLTRNIVIYGEDWRGDTTYEDQPREIIFKKVKVNVEISYFSIEGFEY